MHNVALSPSVAGTVAISERQWPRGPGYDKPSSPNLLANKSASTSLMRPSSPPLFFFTYLLDFKFFCLLLEDFFFFFSFSQEPLLSSVCPNNSANSRSATQSQWVDWRAISEGASDGQPGLEEQPFRPRRQQGSSKRRQGRRAGRRGHDACRASIASSRRSGSLPRGARRGRQRRGVRPRWRS